MAPLRPRAESALPIGELPNRETRACFANRQGAEYPERGLALDRLVRARAWSR
jgi:hypothetical protein